MPAGVVAEPAEEARANPSAARIFLQVTGPIMPSAGEIPLVACQSMTDCANKLSVGLELLKPRSRPISTSYLSHPRMVLYLRFARTAYCRLGPTNASLSDSFSNSCKISSTTACSLEWRCMGFLLSTLTREEIPGSRVSRDTVDPTGQHRSRPRDNHCDNGRP